jgi:cell shape-determining protein MreD
LLAEPGAVRYFSVRVHAALAGFSAAAASLAATVVLAVLRADGAEPSTVVHQLVPTVLGDLLLALALVPLVRLFLRSRGLRKPGPPVLDLTASLR